MAQFPSQSAASGLWSLKKQKRAQQGLNWPPLFGPADDYFEYVTMLLPGNGTNGAQNNTFLDSSTNNFTITRNGNTTQGTFTPFGSNWSNYFNGSSYLSAASSSAFAWGTASFTVECWFFLTATSAYQSLFSTRSSGAVGSFLGFETGTSRPVWYTNSAQVALSAVSAPLNTWNHIAFVKNGTTLTIYLNGTSVVSVTDSTNYVGTTATIGYDILDNSWAFNGYISNLRAVKGTAVYTANFTPPTSPLTAITNTSLLTCQSNRFIDNSSNNFAITRNGDVSVQRFSPFNPTAPYAAGTDGGSGYFDGSGDSLTVANNAALYFGTGDFTIECWINTSATVAYQSIANVYGAPTSNNGWYFALSASGSGLYLSVFSGSALEVLEAGSGLNDGAWHHVAAVRTGTTLSTYIDGTRIATTTNSFDITATSDLRIGTWQSNTRFTNGYISNLRIIKGSGPYNAASSTLTVPTSPLTAITNTSFLTNFINAGIIDNAEMNNLETVGDAQISTAQSKFGGASIAFDGSGDAVTTSPTVNLVLADGNFTVECFVRFNTLNADFKRVLGFQNGSASNSNYSYFIQILPTNAVRGGVCSGSTAFTVDSSATVTTGVWYHLAFVRSGSTHTLYINGIAAGTTTTATFNAIPDGRLWIGRDAGGSFPLDGWIDDLRITKGYARYTANFTPPTAPFPLY